MGGLRHASLKGIRPDKGPRLIRRSATVEVTLLQRPFADVRPFDSIAEAGPGRSPASQSPKSNRAHQLDSCGRRGSADPTRRPVVGPRRASLVRPGGSLGQVRRKNPAPTQVILLCQTVLRPARTRWPAPASSPGPRPNARRMLLCPAVRSRPPCSSRYRGD